MQTFYYHLPTVTCGSCTSYIEKTLLGSPLLKTCSIRTNALDRRLEITFENESHQYADVLRILNSIIEPAHTCEGIDDEKKRVWVRPWWRSHLFLGGMGTALGFLLMGICFFMTGPLSFVVQGVIAGVSTVITLVLGAEFYQSVFLKLKKGILTMDTLFVLSTSVSLVASLAAFISPAFPMMFEAGLLIFGFRHLGLALYDAFKQDVLTQRRFQDQAPVTVSKKSSEGTQIVPLNALVKGDLIELKSGDILPVDGYFDASDGLIVDEIVTGSNNPRRVVQGEYLYAGTRVLQVSSALTFHVMANVSSSHLALLDDKIERAKFEKSPLIKDVDKLTRYFIPAVILAAMISFIVVTSWMGVMCGLMCAISVLTSACPCTLGIITPASLLFGLWKTAQGGVSFNSAAKLEEAHKVNCVVFDYNGTWTQNQPQVMRVVSLSELSESACLGLFAHLEGSSPHLIAKSVRAKAREQKIALPMGAVELQKNHQAGLVLTFEGHRYALGGESLMNHESVLLPTESIQQGLDETVVYLARDRVLIGYVVLKNELRPEVPQVIAELKKMGIAIRVATGEHQPVVARRLASLGIPPEHIRANCLSHKDAPLSQSKKHYIDELKKQGLCVAMVGDAANDGEALVASDVGFALNLGQANEQIQKQAAAVIQSQSLWPVVSALKVARKMMVNIKQNLLFSLIYNVLAVLISGGCLLGLGIVLNPAIGAALMVFQMLFILMNVARFGFSREEKTPSRTLSQVGTSMSYVASLLSLFKLSKQCDADIPSISNSVGLTHAKGEVRKIEPAFHEGSDLLSNRFNQFKCV